MAPESFNLSITKVFFCKGCLEEYCLHFYAILIRTLLENSEATNQMLHSAMSGLCLHCLHMLKLTLNCDSGENESRNLTPGLIKRRLKFTA